MMIKTYATDKRNEIQNEFITRKEGKHEELNHVSKDYQTFIAVYAVILVWLADRSYFSDYHFVYLFQSNPCNIFGRLFQDHLFNSTALLHIGTCLHSSLRLALVGQAIFKRKMI